MAIIKIVVTRKTTNDNITFGEGINKGLTVTGEIYDAEDYKVIVVDANGLPSKVDGGMSLLKCTATVTFRGNEKVYKDIQDKVANYFSFLSKQGIYQIKVGLVIKSNSVSKPVDGVHPILGVPTKKVLINSADLLEVEEPESLEMAEDIIEATTEARENTKEVGKVSLASYLSSKTKLATSTLENALFRPNKQKTK